MGGSGSYARTVALLGVLCAGALVAGCADEADPEREIVATLQEIRTDFDAGRVRRACARMAVGPRCRAILRLLADRAAPSASSVRAGERKVVEVQVRRGVATAVVTLSERVPGRLRFVEAEGGWKLADVGVRADLRRSRWKALPASFGGSRPEPKRLACPPITRIVHHGVAPVSGGCSLRFSTDDMAVVLLTAFGDFEVARCAFGLTFHAASNTTATLADRIRFRGHGICSKVRACPDGETGLRYPWQGDPVRGSLAAGMHLRFDVCVNTPLGRARGMLHYDLVNRGDNLVARPHDYPIGESSVQFVGVWDVQPDTIGSR